MDEFSEIPVYIIGDFNTDLEKTRRYDVLLTDFIDNNKLTCIEYLFPNVNYTYTNGGYKNHIDHVIGNQIATDITTSCKIIQNWSNLSDHNPIITTAELSLIPTNNTFNGNGKRFYKFPWKNESFVERYKIILSELLVHYNYTLNEN
jgi:hypothetical protein